MTDQASTSSCHTRLTEAIQMVAPRRSSGRRERWATVHVIPSPSQHSHMPVAASLQWAKSPVKLCLLIIIYDPTVGKPRH